MKDELEGFRPQLDAISTAQRRLRRAVRRGDAQAVENALLALKDAVNEADDTLGGWASRILDDEVENEPAPAPKHSPWQGLAEVIPFPEKEGLN
jgi:hypothetical protein